MSHKQSLRGKNYESKTETANDYQMSPQLLNHRLNNLNMSLEDATALPVNDTRYNAEEITIDGITFESYRAACRAYNRDHGTAMSRVLAGMSKEDAIKKVSAREFLYENVLFENAKKCCDYYEVPYVAMSNYARAHKITKQEAITYYRNKKKQS